MVNNGGAELWPQSAQLDPGEVTAGKLPHQTVHQTVHQNGTPEWNTKQKNKRRIRQCTTTEHQSSEVHQNNDVHQSRTPDRKQFIAEQYSKCYNRCSTDSETVDQISIHVQQQQSRERRICSRMVKKATRTNSEVKTNQNCVFQAISN